MHATHYHLINGSLEPKDVVSLIGLEIQTDAGNTVSRSSEQFSFVQFVPFILTKKGEQYILLREALTLCMRRAWLSTPSRIQRVAPTHSTVLDTAAPLRSAS